MIAHAIGGREPSEQVGGALDLANRAGTILFNMYTWDFTLRIATIDKTAAQSYLELPPDFEEIESIQATDTLTNSMHLTSLEDLLYRKTFTLDQSNFNFYGALTYADSSDSEGGPPVAQIDIHPTPQDTEAGAFTVAYRRRWPKLVEDNDQIGVPEFAEELYIQICREVAKGYEGDRMDGSALTLADRISKIKNSWLFEDAKAKDSRAQSDYGPIINGHIDSGRTLRDWGINTTVGGPS